jgi:hypothetical protein
MRDEPDPEVAARKNPWKPWKGHQARRKDDLIEGAKLGFLFELQISKYLRRKCV